MDFEVIRREREVRVWVEKVFRVVGMEGILVECVVLTAVKDVCSEASVVFGFLEGGDLTVDMCRGVAGVEVSVSVEDLENLELCGPTVDLFGVSTKSVRHKKKTHIFTLKSFSKCSEYKFFLLSRLLLKKISGEIIQKHFDMSEEKSDSR